MGLASMLDEDNCRVPDLTRWSSLRMATPSQIQVGLMSGSKRKLKEYDKDIRLMTLAELEHHFGAASSGRIIHTRVCAGLIWQVTRAVRSGDLEGVDGNLRSFYYRYVKPVFARIPGGLSRGKDPYETMLDVFSEMVSEGLLSYGELDLTDDNWHHRRLGTDPAVAVVLFAEKTGFFRWLLRMHERFGLTVVALGGAPSFLSSEYLARDMKQAGFEGRLWLLSVVDHDPSGWALAEAFREQLETLGFEAVQLSHLHGPEHFSDVELEMLSYPLPGRQKTMNSRWLELGGGVLSQARGLECDALEKATLTRLLEERLAELGVVAVED